MFDTIWALPALPLFGVLLNLLTGRRSGKRAGLIAGSCVGLAFLISLKLFYDLLQLPAAQRLIEKNLYTWIAAGTLRAEIGMQIDPLSIIMILVVTGISFLIHLYAIGYMHGDPGFNRFFIYLNLFVFAMLILVTANNFLMMFIGWEGVGLCSYLLIGFWFEDPVNATAGRKAFIVNRIGDFGFLLALFLLFVTFGSLDFTDVFNQAVVRFSPGDGIITAITLLLFVGAAGKSAQIPLYIWLPDAMAGPTPVSALIHAATMVTAGVYMVARAHVLYTLAPLALTVVACVGLATALLSATIGLTQFDIKRVLAYSTVSQLGYMFLGLGVGAFGAAIFHLMTHAFFKALLFLGAGSVMHAMSNHTDMRLMGGLKSKMPITYGTMVIGTLAIAGFPGFSGFFSKDEILWQSYAGLNGHPLFWLLGALAAGLTAFYMFRLIFMTFHGKLRLQDEQVHAIHESPRIMTIPLVMLAILSLAGGYVGVPALLGGGQRIEHFLQPVFQQSEQLSHGLETSKPSLHAHSMEWLLMLTVFLVTLISLYLAYLFYIKKTDLPGRLVKKISGLYALVYNKYFIDEAYDAAIVRPLHKTSESFLWRIVDNRLIDGLVNAVGSGIAACGRTLAVIQTGSVQHYALWFVLGTIVLLGAWLF
ncbi:MAG: NADH-quinone oxidoreductase subunit L [bacterium ADurb.Bin478]|nr:MAG: NADH-quinone oxidoreductase subunit L [bacterium ADurb.Bin478]